jgi:hypothetical protein
MDSEIALELADREREACARRIREALSALKERTWDYDPWGRLHTRERDYLFAEIDRVVLVVIEGSEAS